MTLNYDIEAIQNELSSRFKGLSYQLAKGNYMYFVGDDLEDIQTQIRVSRSNFSVYARNFFDEHWSEGNDLEYRPDGWAEKQKQDIQLLAERFRDFLQEKGLWKFITICFNGMAYDSEQGVIESFNIDELVKYYNPETLTVLHEKAINFEHSWDRFEMIKEFFSKNGYWIQIIDSHSFYINREDRD
ncbi:hypothetical protein BK126_26145 [Paenibacillus sp. FSL H7-0326]|uniref:hypothetical protein n=1 Tax=Paenibacillus sp. FSL H7-0326 TaxID=1921144 RepID=UPI00096E3E6C|nr:hypothetical protein [Paenibacillus sp. FSL H7-0326]OMC63678.1 hypothetical protein BK126_26145 [Paenibacillus sp. FSL H7-0326]